MGLKQILRCAQDGTFLWLGAAPVSTDYSVQRLKIREALVPPKPKELERA